MNTPLISIIVPVYKAEAYLRRCVASIIAQTFSNWELILVDDGSPDDSGRLCDAIKDDNPNKDIKVIHKSNGGVASARETGMSNATGIFSIHVDPDDWIEPDTLEVLYEKAIEENADVVVYDFLLDYGPKHQETSSQSIDGPEPFLKRLLTQDRHGSLCNKLIRTELYRCHDIHFPKEMICWEDLFVCCNIFLHQCRISYVGKAMYHYDLHSNSGSMTRMATGKTLEGMKIFCAYFSRALPEKCRSWLLPTKAMILLTAYRCSLLTDSELRLLYPEVNAWFIREYENDFSKPLYSALAKVLKGCSIKRARRRERIHMMCLRITNRLKRLL